MADESNTESSTSDKSPILPEPPLPGLKQQQLPPFYGFAASPYGNFQMFPIMYPALVPGGFPMQQDQEQMNRGAGLYAVSTFPFMGPIAGLPSNTLIPITYNVPTTGPSFTEAGTGAEEQGQAAQQQQPGPQRQVVVRRFQIAIHLDLLLILKLAAVIFLFNQDGSRQRLVLLIFFASLVYLYQTGALAPLVRWLSQGMQRAARPPQPPRPAAQAGNGRTAAAREGNENVALPDGQPGVENENRPANDGNQPANDGNQPENVPEAVAAANDGGNRWWGIVKEVQMIVFGFITSLLPGFHNID